MVQTKCHKNLASLVNIATATTTINVSSFYFGLCFIVKPKNVLTESLHFVVTGVRFRQDKLRKSLQYSLLSPRSPRPNILTARRMKEKRAYSIPTPARILPTQLDFKESENRHVELWRHGMFVYVSESIREMHGRKNKIAASQSKRLTK